MPTTPEEALAAALAKMSDAGVGPSARAIFAANFEALAAGSAGMIREADVEPVGFYIALSGLGYFYQSNRYTLGTVLQVDLGEEGRIAAYEDLIADMVLAYLQGGAAMLPVAPPHDRG